MNKTIRFLARDLDKKIRLDKYLANNLNDLTRSQIKKIILSKNVNINKKLIISASEKIRNNDLIEIKVPENKNEDIKPKKIDLDIVYEDNQLLVINKKSGLVVHPGAGNQNHTLVNGLIYRYKNFRYLYVLEVNHLQLVLNLPTL